MDELLGVERDRLSPYAQLVPHGSPKEWSPAQAEAVRLETLRQVSVVKDTVLEGLAALHIAEQEMDFQAMMGGLRKLLVAGLVAKDVADAAVRRYGPEAVGL